MGNNLLSTTIIKVEPDQIDWDEVMKSEFFVRYEIPFREKRKWDYLHNWYLSISRYPYFLNTPSRSLYVMYPANQEPLLLNYEEQIWKPEPLDIQNKEYFHVLIKLLVSSFFSLREVYVSNNDFYLLLWTTPSGHAKVLRINLSQNWKEDEFYEFTIEDSATTLLREKQVHNNRWQNAYYGVDYKEGLPILRRLHPKALTRKTIEQGVFLNPPRKPYRTHIPLFNISSEFALERSRLFPLWHFITDFIN